jgi:hypothetical protein
MEEQRTAEGGQAQVEDQWRQRLDKGEVDDERGRCMD